MADDPAIYCPLCGNRVPSSLSKCPICATELQKVREKKPPAKAAPTPSEVEDYLHKELPRVELPSAIHACPLCAMELQGGETKCPRCGIPLVSENEMLECPECGALAPEGSKACPSCGVGFEEEEPEIPGPPPIEVIPQPPIPERPFEPAKPVEPAPEMVTSVPGGVSVAAREGLVNGRGATNGTGLVNGRGAVNGTGLVNGTGMTNGTKLEGRVSSAHARSLQVVRRWQFFAVLIALVVVISTFVFLSYAQKGAPVTVDGKFGEWAHIEKYGMYENGGSAQVTVDQWAVEMDGSEVFLYVKTQGDLMGTSDVNSLYLFVDSDGAATTGYRVSGIGADYLLELDGWNGSVQSSTVFQYEPQSSADQYDWNSWTKVGALVSKVSGNQLEAEASLPEIPSLSARFLFFTQDNIGSSASYPSPEKGGLLVIKQEQGSGIDAAGLVVQSSSVSFLKLNITCEGRGGTVGSITPSVLGGTLVTTFEEIPLTVGQPQILDVLVDTTSLAPGTTVTAWLTSSHVSSSFAEVTIVGDPVRAYVTVAPSVIQIDGAFGDWAGRTTADSDSTSVANDNVDVDAVGAVNASDSSYFYVSVVGEMCGGSYVPMIVTKPSGSGGGGGIYIPTRKTGEDLLRIYIDSDLLQSTGYPISSESGTIGADYQIEIRGLDGDIKSRTLKFYSAGQWITTANPVVDAANDYHQIELMVMTAQVGGTSTWRYIVETTDWSGRHDLASSVPSGARGWPIQSGLTGADTSFPGQRKIFYDGTNLWSFYFDGTDTVTRYSTDGGKTWTAPTIPTPFSKPPVGVKFASIWYDSSVNQVYVVGDRASQQSQSLSVINGTVNPATHTITWRPGGEASIPLSAKSESSKYAYICKDALGYLWVIGANKTNTGIYWNLTVFRSVAQSDVSSWVLSGSMITGGLASADLKGVIVPAGTGSQVWAIYTYGGNVACRKYTGSWSSEVLIQTGSGTLNGPMILAPPSAVVDARGVVHVVYGNCYENGTAKPHVMYAHNRTGSTSFTTALDLDPTIPQNVGDISPSISIDSSTGNLFAFWIRTNASDVGTTIMGKKNVSGTWTWQSFLSDNTTQKQFLSSIYSSPSEAYISWQWTQNATAGTIEVQFESKIPELPSVVMPVMFIVGVVMYASRRKIRRRD